MTPAGGKGQPPVGWDACLLGGTPASGKGGGALLMLHVTRTTINGTGDPIDVSWEAIKFTYVP